MIHSQISSPRILVTTSATTPLNHGACRLNRPVEWPNSPFCTPATNASHSSPVNLSTGPAGSFESRTSTDPSGRYATWTQLPWRQNEDLGGREPAHQVTATSAAVPVVVAVVAVGG